MLDDQIGLARRLAGYLKEAQPLLRLRGRPTALTVRADRLSCLLTDLRAPLTTARSTGAFMNVWTVAGLKRNELRNAAVLAWLLNPRGTHGLVDGVAEMLFRRVSGAPTWLTEQLDFKDIAVVTEECPLGSDENRVDISITARTFIMFIEVKLDAPEGTRQLARYVKAAEEKRASHGKAKALVIFLTPRRKIGDLPSGVATLGWQDVELALISVIIRLPEKDARRALLQQFAAHIRSF